MGSRDCFIGGGPFECNMIAFFQGRERITAAASSFLHERANGKLLTSHINFHIMQGKTVSKRWKNVNDTPILTISNTL